MKTVVSVRLFDKIITENHKSPPKRGLENINIEGEYEDIEECEESEMEDSNDLRQFKYHSQGYSALGAFHGKTSQMSNMHMDSILQEKDYSINRLQHELNSRDRESQKWRKRFK